jgi:paraquat-inducible protein A
LDSDFASNWSGCPSCDLLLEIPELPKGGKALCVRCGCVLARRPSNAPELPLVLTLTAIIVFIVANASPLMNLSVIGRDSTTTILGGAWEMWQQGQHIAGVLIAFCAVIAPGLYLAFMLTLLTAARRSPVPHWVGEMLRWVHHFELWSMLEVMMLGILVALIKIAQLATVEAGIGMYATFVLILLVPSIMTTFDIRDLWRRVERLEDDVPPAAPALAESAR